MGRKKKVPPNAKVAPKDRAGRRFSSAGALGINPRLPIRSNAPQSGSFAEIGLIGLSTRLLSEGGKVLQSNFTEILEKCRTVERSDLLKFLKDEINVDEIWQKAYGVLWEPTTENMKKLTQSFLQSCMIYLRSQTLGKPDPRTVTRRFLVSIATDVCELVALVNIGLFFHWKFISAGWILSGCVIFERILQTILCTVLERRSITSVVTSVLGIKTFLTSYFTSYLGLRTKLKGSKINLFTTRLIHKGFNTIFVAAPQNVLNAYLIFSNLTEGSEISTEMKIQMSLIALVSFSVGISLTNLVQEHQRQHSDRGFYKSMTQIYKPNVEQHIIIIVKTCWNIFHFMMVTCGLGALIAKAPLAVWVSIVTGFFIVLNVMRYFVNEGEIRFYKRMNLQMIGSAVLTLLCMILYVLGVGLIPLSVLRWHFLLGPTIFGVGWISSFLISSVSVLYFSSNVALWIAFGCLSFFYVIAVFIYFRLLKSGAWKTFIWSNENWKDKLRNEWWANPTYESNEWGDIHLFGDIDAHYSGMVLQYLETDLPWGKLTDWLKRNKQTFRANPPIWLTKDWLALIPKNVQDKVWDPVEYRDLLRHISKIENAFSVQQSANQTLSEKKSKKPKDGHSKKKDFRELMRKDNNSNRSKMKTDKQIDEYTKGKYKNNENSNAATPDKRTDERTKLTIVSSSEIQNSRGRETMGENENSSSPSKITKGKQGNLESRAINANNQSIRKKLITNINKRKSSLSGSMSSLPLMASLGEDDVPIVLKKLLKEAESLTIDNIIIASAEVMDKELFDILLGRDKKATVEDMIFIICKGFLGQINQQKKKAHVVEGVSRILFAAFFELLDEVSDFVVALVFAYDSKNLQWASVLMFVFMGLNRFVGLIWSKFHFKESLLGQIETLLGVKCITDTYRIVVRSGASQGDAAVLMMKRAVFLGSGIVFESLLQMILQLSIVLSGIKSKEIDQGVLPVQIASVIASCFSIGLSLGSVSIDNAKTLKPIHPSANPSMKLLFIILSITYIINVIIFLANIDENIFTFLFSTINWKQTLRDELWGIPLHGSGDWGIPELLGNHDAHHAAHIAAYMSCDLPWDKITVWLRRKKDAFRESPPLWMTPEWFDNLTPEVKLKVWTEPGELEELITKVKQICDEAKNI
eukprot:g2179.t1